MNVSILDLKREYQYMKNDILNAINKCLEHQSWILGPEVKELEQKIAEFLDIKYCVGCSSGTDALVLGLRAIAIEKGMEFFSPHDEIITTPFTFTATGDAILRSGATPVFVDIEPDTFNINPEFITTYLQSEHGKNVKGIIPVHLYGTPCNMDAIMNIAHQYEIFVLEDVAQAFGGSYDNSKLGTIGDIGAFSFFPSKNLGGYGDGGMVACHNASTENIIRTLIKHGGKDKYNVDHIGYNARLDTIQAAILLVKLIYLDEFNERRKKIAQRYNQELSEIKEVKVPISIQESVFHQYTIRVKNGKRDQLQAFLKEKCIGTMVYYPFCLHQMKLFQGRAKVQGKMEQAEKATQEVLSLPIEPLMTEEEQTYVIDTIKEFFTKS